MMFASVLCNAAGHADGPAQLALVCNKADRRLFCTAADSRQRRFVVACSGPC
jgi:hypothetical protein